MPSFDHLRARRNSTRCDIHYAMDASYHGPPTILGQRASHGAIAAAIARGGEVPIAVGERRPSCVGHGMVALDGVPRGRVPLWKDPA
jgi:hypothetical protein